MARNPHDPHIAFVPLESALDADLRMAWRRDDHNPALRTVLQQALDLDDVEIDWDGAPGPSEPLAAPPTNDEASVGGQRRSTWARMRVPFSSVQPLLAAYWTILSISTCRTGSPRPG
ncbi:hypothetical protein [Bounagaea algeriensis]